jgi:hypothetical protein
MDETWPAPDAVLKSGSLSFTGHSTVGDFVGTTTSASGGVIGNANLANARGWVEATVSSLSTGNRLRDRDLRSTMDVATYPAMRFELAGVTVESPAATSDTVDASGSFPIDLGDYKVGGLTRLFGTLRVRREIEVRFRVRFEPAPHTRS